MLVGLVHFLKEHEDLCEEKIYALNRLLKYLRGIKRSLQ
jgi:hypothetical protein